MKITIILQITAILLLTQLNISMCIHKYKYLHISIAGKCNLFFIFPRIYSAFYSISSVCKLFGKQMNLMAGELWTGFYAINIVCPKQFSLVEIMNTLRFPLDYMTFSLIFFFLLTFYCNSFLLFFFCLDKVTNKIFVLPDIVWFISGIYTVPPCRKLNFLFYFYLIFFFLCFYYFFFFFSTGIVYTYVHV